MPAGTQRNSLLFRGIRPRTPSWAQLSGRRMGPIVRFPYGRQRIRMELRRRSLSNSGALTYFGQSSCHRREAGGGAGTRTPTPAWPASSSWTSVFRGAISG